MTKKQEADFANAIMKFVDRNGRIVQRSGSPFSAHLSMIFEDGDLVAKFSATSSPHSNGSSYVVVTKAGTRLFEASGKFTVSAYDVNVETWIHGDWEHQFNGKSKDKR